ncbi:unnamed protein product [Penicillium olsonii]|uniref:Pre-mRNA-splicing factor CWC2 n=1 Tax=Penicillium olsonii TaxID=99116 RepID=A0A9W4MJP5_PENOL|nr:unnamed protein product [Penicillium olsonii]CAG7971214.1 unnamed protein product [Penicillium olsonii]
MADTSVAEPSAPVSATEETIATQNEASETTQGDQQVQPVRKTKLIRRKKKPARIQVDASTLQTESPAQPGADYNIWYNKASGNDDDKYGLNQPAPYRVNIARDSGYTLADRIVGSYFCVHFARGSCTQGPQCQYLHRLPSIHDMFNPNVDVFGREKHSDYKEDMSGVGSFMRVNRTLYVGRCHVTDDIEEVISRHFQEFGQIDRIRVLTGRGVGFVTYSTEGNAQFAMEAMARQSLDHEEIINVRWATVDPNPMAQKREARRLEEQAAEAVRRALPAAFVAEIEGRDPEAKKRKKIEGSFGLQGYDVPDDVWHARTRQLEDANQAQLDAPQQPLMIESASESASVPAPVEQPQSNSIFSSSAISALRGLNGSVKTQAAPKAAGGPLVAYGSDDESD